VSNVILLVRRNKTFTAGWPADAVLAQRKELWDNLFRVPYFEFRQRVAAIAGDNYESINVDKIYHYIEDFFSDQASIKSDDWILPIDDDDWLCNDIGQTIKTLIPVPAKNLIVWRCNVASVFKLAPPNWDSLAKIEPDIFSKTGEGAEPIYSCCYALRNELVTEKNLLYHMAVTKLEHEREYLSHAGLESCYLFMPSSQSFLGRLLNNTDELKTGVEKVQLLDENKLAHKPEFVYKLKQLKELFAQL